MAEVTTTASPAVTAARRLGDDGKVGAELCLRGMLSEGHLLWALELRERTGADLASIMLSTGLVERRELTRVRADLHGLAAVDLVEQPPEARLVRRFAPDLLVGLGFVPLTVGGGVATVAVRDDPSAAVVDAIKAELGPEVAVRFVMTSWWDVDQAVRTLHRDRLVHTAVRGLYERSPEESAYTVVTPRQFAVLAVLACATCATIALWPVGTLLGLNAVVNVAFTASIAFKLAVALAGARRERHEPVTGEEAAAIPDTDLPSYTILVPVFREANIVGKLVTNLGNLDYPREKLEILLLMEEDDPETIAAARSSGSPDTVRFLVVPDAQPKTKPKACNVGLLFARGEYLVIYDAEDRPEPDQLRKVVAAFRKAPDHVVCVQCALNYFNATENVLTRMFTLEYSYWFDYMLPGLDALSLPIPLGGTSNHFRTDALRRLGGWDPYNVTEDADLGIRASAEGWSVSVVGSTTYEEANAEVRNWVRQRSRWIKGYLQTTLVHLRHPVRLVRTCGLRQALGFATLIGGTCVTFLAVPLLYLLMVAWIAGPRHLVEALFPPVLIQVSAANLVVGNSLMVYLNMLAVYKRRRYELLPYALLNPFYWLLHSIAAYKALWQLITRPFFWEKTVHGITTHADTEPVLVG